MVIIFGKASSPVKRWICRALYPDLATKAAERLKAQGDGTLGWPPGAPFNAIVLTAGGRFVPEPLKHQLVITIGPERGPRRLLPITRTGAQSWQEEELLQVYFVPLRGAYGFALT